MDAVKDGYITVPHYCEKYNKTRYVIYVHLNKGHKYIHKVGTVVYIDEKSLLKRREFYVKVWNQSHENFYRMLEYTETKNVNRLATVLSKHLEGSINSWTIFMRDTLFNAGFIDDSITSYKISKRRWEFFRFTSHYIRRMERLASKH